MHLLAYGFDPDEPQLAAERLRMRDARVDRVDAVAADAARRTATTCRWSRCAARPSRAASAARISPACWSTPGSRRRSRPPSVPSGRAGAIGCRGRAGTCLDAIAKVQARRRSHRFRPSVRTASGSGRAALRRYGRLAAAGLTGVEIDHPDHAPGRPRRRCAGSRPSWISSSPAAATITAPARRRGSVRRRRPRRSSTGCLSGVTGRGVVTDPLLSDHRDPAVRIVLYCGIALFGAAHPGDQGPGNLVAGGLSGCCARRSRATVTGRRLRLAPSVRGARRRGAAAMLVRLAAVPASTAALTGLRWPRSTRRRVKPVYIDPWQRADG